MSLDLIPAIDLIDGKCVRLTEGELSQKKIYSDKPHLMAKRFQEQGAKKLHLVDLDGAFHGEMKNLNMIENIISETNLSVQVGGGVRSFGAIERLLDLGVTWVILGTKAHNDPGFLKEALSRYPGQITVGVDVKAEKVATEGWVKVSDTRISDYVSQLGSLGVTRIILTDISKDGKLQGTNLDLLKGLLSFQNINFVMSGGVGSIEDIKALMEIETDSLEGVILGKAIYEKKIELQEAISLVKG